MLLSVNIGYCLHSQLQSQRLKIITEGATELPPHVEFNASSLLSNDSHDNALSRG